MAFSASCKGLSRYVIGWGASSRRQEHRQHNDSVSLKCQHHGYQVRTDLLARTRLAVMDINLRHVCGTPHSQVDISQFQLYACDPRFKTPTACKFF